MLDRSCDIFVCMIKRTRAFHATSLHYNLEFFQRRDGNYFYFLGAAVTDGCISSIKKKKILTHVQRFSLTSKDTDWIQLLQSAVGGSYHADKSGNYSRLALHNPEIISTLHSDGCVERK